MVVMIVEMCGGGKGYARQRGGVSVECYGSVTFGADGSSIDFEMSGCVVCGECNEVICEGLPDSGFIGIVVWNCTEMSDAGGVM